MSNKIGLGLAIVAGVNAMVGASIFVNPAALATQVGPAALLTYGFVVLSVIMMALGLAHVAARYPQEGAFYVYARSWGGHIAGTLASISYLLGLVLAMATLTKITGTYIARLLGDVIPASACGLSTLWSLTALNMLGATLTVAGQVVLLVLTFVPVVIIMGACLMRADVSNVTPFMPYGWSSLPAAIKYVIFGFFGFETAAALYEVVEKPEKNVSRAIIIATMLVGAIYMSFIGSIFLGIPRDIFTSSAMPLAEALQALMPGASGLATAVGWAIVITIMGTLHSLIWSLAQLMSSTAKTLGIAHVSIRAAAMSIGLLVSTAFLFIENIDLFFSLTAMFLTLAYGMSLAALLPARPGHALSTRILGLVALIVCSAIGLQAAYDLVTILTHQG